MTPLIYLQHVSGNFVFQFYHYNEDDQNVIDNSHLSEMGAFDLTTKARRVRMCDVCPKGVESWWVQTKVHRIL